MTSTEQPLPLGRLPKEVRLMVYERLPIRTVHVVARRDEEDDPPTIIVAMRFLERNILSTNKVISSEAEPYYRRRLQYADQCRSLRIVTFSKVSHLFFWVWMTRSMYSCARKASSALHFCTMCDATKMRNLNS
jgi:hypothetical protein